LLPRLDTRSFPPLENLFALIWGATQLGLKGYLSLGNARRRGFVRPFPQPSDPIFTPFEFLVKIPALKLKLTQKFDLAHWQSVREFAGLSVGNDRRPHLRAWLWQVFFR
jgi:hypothetical protein